MYWHGDPELAKSYAEAYEIMYNRRETELWKLGVYFMRANACLWDKDATYPEQPLFKIKTEEELQMEEFNKMQSMKSFWEIVADTHNAKIKQGSAEKK